jgi:hypothetical protein
MPTILSDAHPGDPVPGRTEKRVVERLDEEIPEAGDPCVWRGRPCVLYGMWDMAEDWSGEFVTFPRPYSLVGAHKIAAKEFWALVRDVHGL